MERSFQTAQDRLVKGLRVAGAKTLEQANAYLEGEYALQWESKFTVVPTCSDDAHRSLGKQHDLAAILSKVDSRVVTNDYTIRHNNRVLQIVREDIKPRMRGSSVRVETRRNGETAVRFGNQYVRVEQRNPAAKTLSPITAPVKKNPTVASAKKKPRAPSKWMKDFFQKPAPSLKEALNISNATS